MASLVVVIAPLVFAAIGASRPYHGFWTNFSVALGFVGLAMMGLEFALVARFEAMAAPFGQDALLQFHRQIGYVGLGFVLLHAALSASWGQLWATLPFSPDVVATPALVMLGSLAVLAMIALVVPSVWRRQLRIPYEWWHAIHTVLAVVAVVGALLHVYLVDGYVNSPWKRVLWGVMSAAFLGLLGWVRLVKPRAMSRRPWRLERVATERGQTTTLEFSPPDGLDFRFDPGQFAWFALGRSPFSLTMHPFSFSSSAERTGIEIAVNVLGDFTSRVSAAARRASTSSAPERRPTWTARTASSRWIETRGRASVSSRAEWVSRACSACCAPWPTAGTFGQRSSSTRTATGKAWLFAKSSNGCGARST